MPVLWREDDPTVVRVELRPWWLLIIGLGVLPMAILAAMSFIVGYELARKALSPLLLVGLVFSVWTFLSY